MTKVLKIEKKSQTKSKLWHQSIYPNYYSEIVQNLLFTTFKIIIIMITINEYTHNTTQITHKSCKNECKQMQSASNNIQRVATRTPPKF